MKNYDETELGKETTYIENYDPTYFAQLAGKKRERTPYPQKSNFMVLIAGLLMSYLGSVYRGYPE